MVERHRQIRGKTNYLAGLAAEDSVSRHYDRTGMAVIARRWRGSVGEIDLVLRNETKLIFVEVKKSSTHDLANEHFSPAQQRRVLATAEEYFGNEPCEGIDEVQIDLALVDAMGRIEIVPNALMH